MTYEKRWARIRWEELRWDEVWNVKSAVWSVGREECSVKCGVWRKQWEVRSVKCGLWSVKFAVCSVKCEVWSLKSTVWSEVLTAKGAVWRVQCEVWRLSSVKCDVGLQMWHVKQDTTFAECTHALGWRTAHASSIDEKGLIYINI